MFNILAFTEPLQITMYAHERKALETYKAITGKSYNFIVDQAIKDFIADDSYNLPANTADSKERKRLAVRLSKETDLLLKEYCQINKEKMSPIAVKATMKYIVKSL